MALGTVALTIAAAVYVAPKVLGLTWSFGMTEVGKTAATWVVLSAIYDLMVNTGENDAFTHRDAGITGLLAIGTRALLRRR